MITTLVVLGYVCALSLFFVLVIPPLAPTGLFMRFLPQDIRRAAKDHPDPPAERRILGYLLTAVLAAAYVGGIVLIGADALRHGCGFPQWADVFRIQRLRLSSRCGHDAYMEHTSSRACRPGQ